MVPPLSVMPCLDMKDGRVVKGVHFVGLRDAGDPAECARQYCVAGADELALLDIAATVEGRPTLLDVVRRVVAAATVPLTVGGGIADGDIARSVLDAGAAAVSVGSAAVKRPELIGELAKRFGGAAVVVALDVDVNAKLPSGYEVYVDGGRTATGLDAVELAKRFAGSGAGTLLPTTKAGDGARTGFDAPLLAKLKTVAGDMRLVASGGAGELRHFAEAAAAGATVLLAASVFHFGTFTVGQVKDYLRARGYRFLRDGVAG